MAVKQNHKGFVYTLEAIIASILLLTTAIAVVPQFQDTQNTNEDIQDRVRSGLETLDKTGQLREAKSVEKLEQDIESVIPRGYSHNVLLTEVNVREIQIDINSLKNAVFRDRAETDLQSEWNQGKFNETTADRGNKLVGYWKFDEEVKGDGGNVKDHSLYENTGTTRNGIKTGQEGVFDTNAYTFNGENDYINISNSASLDVSDSDQISITAWVKPKDDDTHKYIFSNSRDCCGDYGGYNFHISRSNSLKGKIWNGTHSEAISTNFEALEKWSFVSFVADKNNLKLYINGELKNTLKRDIDIGSPSYSNQIGKLASHDLYYFNGSLDETRIYKRALTQQEIEELYRTNRGRFTDLGIGHRNRTEDLTGYWRLDKTSGTISDYSGNNNYAINNGAKRGKEGVFSTNGINLSSGDALTISNTDEISKTFSTNGLTIAFWIKHTNDTSSWDNILRWNVVNETGAEHTARTEMAGNSNRSIYTRFIAENNECRDSTDDGGFWARNPDMNHEPERWNLYTVTYDGDTITEYSNGQVQETSNPSCNLADISSDIEIVSLPNSQLMDELKFYNRALSEEEVQQLYFNGQQGSFTGNYSQNFTIPEGEVPKEIQINSRNVGSSENVSWAKISTDKGESAEFKLDAGDTDRNYSLGFNQEAEEVSVEFNFSVNNETPAKSPVIDNFRIWTNDSAEESYYIYEEGSTDAQFYFSEADNFNVSFNQERLITDYSGEGYEFSNLPDNEGYLKLFGTAEGTAEVNSKSIRGESPEFEDVKNINYIINEDGAKEVTVSLWQ